MLAELSDHSWAEGLNSRGGAGHLPEQPGSHPSLCLSWWRRCGLTHRCCGCRCGAGLLRGSCRGSCRWGCRAPRGGAAGLAGHVVGCVRCKEKIANVERVDSVSCCGAICGGNNGKQNAIDVSQSAGEVRGLAAGRSVRCMALHGPSRDGTPYSRRPIRQSGPSTTTTRRQDRRPAVSCQLAIAPGKIACRRHR